jgi:aldose 1-epimerase
MIHADQYLPVDDERIPLGWLSPVKGGPCDINQPKPVGRDIVALDAQLTLAGGYDHNWVLAGEGFRRVAELSHPATGRCMTIFTDQPGLQLYSGNYLGNEATGKGGAHYPRYSGIALETQHWPDAPNQPSFPSTILRPGEVFASRARCAFSA